MCEAGLSCRVCERRAGGDGARAAVPTSTQAKTPIVPSFHPSSRFAAAVFENESGCTEYNRTTCEIEAFTMAETGSPVAWRTVSSARSWVE